MSASRTVHQEVSCRFSIGDEHPEVGNVDITLYDIPGCFITKIPPLTLGNNGEMVFKYFLRDCFKPRSDLLRLK